MPDAAVAAVEAEPGDESSQLSVIIASEPEEDRPDGAVGRKVPEAALRKELESEEGSEEAAGVVSVVVLSQTEEIATRSSVAASGSDEKAAAIKKGFLPANGSDQDLCRVCQLETEEALLDLGCRCRGELSKAHRSCIDAWFHTIGSNKCEICRQVASNVPFPQSQPTVNYWVWRVNPADTAGRREHGCFTPAWVALSILIGGLLLDVLISVSLGVAALPVNIIVGIAIVLGLGTTVRLLLECCHEWNLRRNHPELISPDTVINRGYPPTV